MSFRHSGDSCVASDSIEVNCDPCTFDGIKTEAQAFCQECNELLCHNCTRSHRKFQAFRHHRILHGDCMPKTGKDTTPKLALKLCDDHPLNDVEFYCVDHKSVFCRLCNIAKHSSCECKHIRDTCDKSDQSKLSEAINKIETIRKDFEGLNMYALLEIDCSGVTSKRSRAQLVSLRQQMAKFIDELEIKVSEEEIKAKGVAAALRDNIRMYVDAVDHITSLQDDIDHVSESNDDIAIFAARTKLKKLNAEYTTVKNTILSKPKNGTPEKDRVHLIEVQRLCDSIDKKVNTNVTESSEQEDTKIDDEISVETRKLFENINPIEKHLKSINTERNDSACDITGSLFLQDGSLVLCDHANSNLILLDKDLDLLHTLPVLGNPWDVALVNQKEIVVSLKRQKSLTYVEVDSRRLEKCMSIYLKRVPWGVAVYKDNLITSFHNNPGEGVIEIRNRHGKIVNNIAKDRNDEYLFVCPCYITVDQNNGDIYVTDSRRNNLTVLSLEGKPLHRIESNEFRWPRKVILDIQGNCLLCASLADKLILINKKSESSQESNKGKSDDKVWLKTCKRPQTVSVRWEDQTTVVCFNDRNQILVLN